MAGPHRAARAIGVGTTVAISHSFKARRSTEPLRSGILSSVLAAPSLQWLLVAGAVPRLRQEELCSDSSFSTFENLVFKLLPLSIARLDPVHRLVEYRLQK